MAACQLLLEITTFLRETFPYMPRPRPEPLVVSGQWKQEREMCRQSHCVLCLSEEREAGITQGNECLMQRERSHCLLGRWAGHIK